MDEYNPMNYTFEPEQEPEQEPAQEPVQENKQEYKYEYTPYNPVSEHQKKEPQKNGQGVKLIALVAVVAVLASIGGSLLTGVLGDLRGKREENEAQTEETTVVQEDGYELDVYQLPSQLNSNDVGKSLTPVDIYELTVNSVVGIKTEATTNAFGQEAVSASAGSGFILTDDGYVITNQHVIADADVIKVELFNEEIYEATLVGSDSAFDIAVLKIEAEDLVPVTVGDSDALKVGEEVAAIGNPLGELTFTMTTGILSALDREINTDGNPQNMLQTNAAINSGNSGGPLFDMNGNVIGVTTAKYSGTTNSGTIIEGLGFAIPINTALKVAYDLVDHGYVRDQAYLGVTVSTLDSKTASYYSLPVGPRVEAVTDGSCAQKGGVQVGDIIISLNGIETATHPELLAVLKKCKAGETVELKVYRAGAELTLTVTLDEKPRQEDLEAQEKEFQEKQEQQQVQPQQPETVDPFEYFFGDSYDPFDPFGFGFGN